MNSIILLSVVCFVNFNEANVLPEFITPCKGTDPNLNECANIAANKAIPNLVKGYPKLNIPVLSPLEIPKIKVENSGQLKIELIDVIVYGLENSKVSNYVADLKSNHFGFTLSIPNLNVQGQYKMSGQILILPLTGKGSVNMTATNGDYNIDISYTLYDKNGAQHMKLEKVNVDLDIKEFTFYFGNLLSANKQISDDANKFLNKEWRQVLKEIEPAVKEAVAVLILDVGAKLVDNVPYLDIYGGEIP